LPRAVALYGSLPQQLKKSDSFASQLARLLKVRADLHLYAARLADVPGVQAKGLLVLVHELPESSGLEITAINFGDRAVNEAVPIRGAAPGAKAIDVLDPQSADVGYRRRRQPAVAFERIRKARRGGLRAECAAQCVCRPGSRGARYRCGIARPAAHAGCGQPR